MTSPLEFCRRASLLAGLLLVFLAPYPAFSADDSVAGKAQQVVRETSSAVSEAGRSAADTAKNLWERIDSARLKNRKPDQIAAWVIIGLLVGSAAGMMTTLRTTGLGKMGRLLLGLSGAFLGGIMVQLGKFDFGWGPVLISYEELFFSLLGAIVIVVAARLIWSTSKKKDSAA
jgi:uncharacterized membrane protein YeaQ/YmgE (transglycosylase-associated protein family)